MLQTILTIAIIAAAALWVGYRLYRSFAPKNKAGCGGSCGCGHELGETKPTASTPKNPQTVFFSEDDLVRRLKARR
jgi:hypothetical protein